MLENLVLMLTLALSGITPSFANIKDLIEDPLTMAELQDIAYEALVSENEVGGEICGDYFDRINLRIIRNRFVDYSVNPYTADISYIPQLREIIQKEFIAGECSPYSQSEGWRNKIDYTLKLLELAEENPQNHLFLEEAVSSYQSMVNSRYGQETKGSCAIYIGHFHTHDDGSSFSEPDGCNIRQTKGIQILVSVKKSAPETFDVHFAKGGFTANVGTYTQNP